MRAHGEPDFPDPNGHGVIQISNATGILEQDSPQYQKAAHACQSLDSGFDQSRSAPAAAHPTRETARECG